MAAEAEMEDIVSSLEQWIEKTSKSSTLRKTLANSRDERLLNEIADRISRAEPTFSTFRI